MMEPGESYDIEIAVPPDHVPGTNWYHPHAHGSADVQIASGAVGALIIEGDFADVPEIAAAKERLFVLTEAVFDSFGMVEDFGTLFPETAARFLAVNGVREPTITMRPGEVQRWRILHAGWQDDLFMDLGIRSIRSPATHPSVTHGPDRTAQSLIKPTDYPGAMLMAPGQRIDVLVQAGKPGTYAFRAAPYDEGYAAPTGPIARLVVEGDPLPMNLPAKLPTLPEKLIGDEEITGTRLLTFSQARVDIERAEFWQTFRFMVDGKTFDADRVDQRVRLGAVEEWTIINKDMGDDHVFHIHVNDMLLTKINGDPLPEPIWMDTAIVPRNGSITFRSRFLDFTGKFMLHCHMMNHEDLGMMQVVEVYADN